MITALITETLTADHARIARHNGASQARENTREVGDFVTLCCYVTVQRNDTYPLLTAPGHPPALFFGPLQPRASPFKDLTHDTPLHCPFCDRRSPAGPCCRNSDTAILPCITIDT